MTQRHEAARQREESGEVQRELSVRHSYEISAQDIGNQLPYFVLCIAVQY